SALLVLASYGTGPHARCDSAPNDARPMDRRYRKPSWTTQPMTGHKKHIGLGNLVDWAKRNLRVRGHFSRARCSYPNSAPAATSHSPAHSKLDRLQDPDERSRLFLQQEPPYRQV